MKTTILTGRMQVYIIISTILILLPLNAWCQDPVAKSSSKQGEHLQTEGDNQIVSQISNETISASDLKNYLSYRPLPQHSPITEKAVKKRLDEMIVGEILYQEALRLNIHRDSKIRRSIQQIVSQKLLEKQIDKQVWTRPIEEKELQAYYDEHKYEFDHPEQVRLADIFIEVPPNATRKQRAEKKKKAESSLAKALKLRDKRFGFGKLIRKYSDTHAKYPIGDTGYFDADGKPLGLDTKLTEEAFNLKGVSRVCDHVVETPDGYHVIMLIGKRPPVRRSLDNVKSEIKQRIRREEMTKARQSYIEGLRKKADIQIDDKVIAEIVKELKEAPQQQPSPEMKKVPPRPRQAGNPPPFPGQRN